MILRWAYLRRKPAIFQQMSGLTVALFEEVVWDVRPALAAARYAQQERPQRPQRQRAVGAGGTAPCPSARRSCSR